ncbi:NUDIX domain-containing protein [Oricola sp.]|uniref:NUDIX domain-containing protein n=1 Tax=Oricola sp. TaxID=1979950 RepID=UPI0025E8A29B|nr:NUDIX domain-containing protein [Oricola sp.]MCI5074395.1 NUDIX domain-containing protein [Oricola sp.]
MAAKLRMRFFHFWFLLSRPMTLGVRAMAFDSQGRILLVKHSYVPGWYLPGGGVEPGESVLDALAKELDEEANTQLGQPPRLLSVHFNRRMSKRDHVVVYLCEDVRQTEPKRADREILEAEFFPLDALPDGVTASTLRRIREFGEAAAPDPLW